MQDEEDLHASFDSLSRFEKVMTLFGLTLVAWTVLGVIGYGIWKLFHA